MTKKLNFLLVLVMLLQACEKDDFCNCLESKGSDITETRQLSSFAALEMNNNVDIILTPDTTEFVEITCGDNLMDGIKTEVKDGRLVIENINRCNWLRDFKNKFTANIHFRYIRQINNNGSGNLTCADTIRQDYLQTECWNGMGTLTFLFNGDELFLKIHTGPADIIAEGKTNLLYIYSAGNGIVKAPKMAADRVELTSVTTGDCQVYPLTQLNVNIGYNGDVYYKGNPQVINQYITGDGQLIPL